MIPENIQKLAQIVQANAFSLVCEAEEKISEAATAAVERRDEDKQAGDKPKEPVVSFTITVKWGLDSNTVNTGLGISIKSVFDRSQKLNAEDPNQPQLFGGASVRNLAQQPRLDPAALGEDA